MSNENMARDNFSNDRRATITDVAREAGTGKTSISRYLNGETGVLSTELRERIEEAIAKLDYRPNQMARGLKRGRNRLVGMLVADLTNPYSVEVLQGVEAACHAYGYMPLICHAANEVDLERRYLQLLSTYRVEGVIVNALGVKEETLETLARGGVPVVLVSSDPKKRLIDRYFKTTFADTNGNYSISGVIPGSYLALVWPESDPSQVQDPDLLTQLEKHATRVSVERGGTASQDLKMTSEIRVIAQTFAQ